MRRDVTGYHYDHQARIYFGSGNCRDMTVLSRRIFSPHHWNLWHWRRDCERFKITEDDGKCIIWTRTLGKRKCNATGYLRNIIMNMRYLEKAQSGLRWEDVPSCHFDAQSISIELRQFSPGQEITPANQAPVWFFQLVVLMRKRVTFDLLYFVSAIRKRKNKI